MNNIKEHFPNPVVTMGVFDGMHNGHQAILRRVVRQAKKVSGTSIVLTFDPHPNKILGGGSESPLLLSIRHRLKLIEQLGIDVCLVVKFSKRLAQCGAEYFVKNVLIEKLGMVEFIVGQSHTFGYQKEGRADFLRELASRYKFTLTIVSQVKVGKSLASSSRIRSLIKSGRLNQAARLLGRPVSLLGTVVKGKARGRLLGYPTANLNPHHEVIPPEGVYVVSGTYRKRLFGGILNIGSRPTFGESEPVVEVHLFDLKADLYGKELEVYFLKRLRPERLFSSKEKLIAQLRRDEIIARQILRRKKKHISV